MPEVASATTVTLYVPGVDDVQLRPELPVTLAVRLTLGAVNGWQARPAGKLNVSDKVTVPAKLKVLVRVRVEVNTLPTVPLGDVAAMLKSPT